MAKSFGTALLVGGTIVLGLGLPVSGAQVSINHLTEYQTIEGFGAFYEAPDISKWNHVFSELGISMIRVSLPYNASEFAGRAHAMKATRTECIARGDSVRFIASVWSPPAAWKITGPELGLDPSTNKLMPSHYADFGNHCVSFLNALRDSGIVLYGLSLQNEAAFPENYPSCVYTSIEYRDMVKVAGPIVHAAYPNVKLFGAEDMLANWGTMVGPTIADTVARNQMGALAVHGYLDGVTPQPASASATKWRQAYTNVHTVNKPLWMTETSGYDYGWEGGIQLAEMIYAALKYGKAGVWMWWSLSDGDGTMGLLQYDARNSHYYCSRQFYRWIRPGAVMVDAVSDDTLVLVCAFNHKVNHTFTMVLINSATAARSVNLTTGAYPPSFARYVSDTLDSCRSMGTTLSSAAIALPPRSVTTLYATNYSPTAVARTAAVVGRSATVGEVRVYALTGRLVAVRANGSAVTVRDRLASGAYVRASVGGSSRDVAAVGIR
jgi:O-glycosyl hydrolase